MIKNSISNCTVTRSTQLSKMHTLHLASPAPSAFCAWSVLASPFSAGLFPSLPASAFPFFPLGTFSPFFAGAFLGLGSGFGGAGFFYLGERRKVENISTIDQRKQPTTKPQNHWHRSFSNFVKSAVGFVLELIFRNPLKQHSEVSHFGYNQHNFTASKLQWARD